MQDSRTYLINVRTLAGSILNFKGVRSYAVEDGHLIFTDELTGLKKRFPVANTEISEEAVPFQHFKGAGDLR